LELLELPESVERYLPRTSELPAEHDPMDEIPTNHGHGRLVHTYAWITWLVIRHGNDLQFTNTY